MERVILIRYGEIGLKGKNRRMFENTLVANLERVLRGLPVKVNRTRERILLEPNDQAPGGPLAEAWDESEIYARLSLVFGVVSFSPVIKTRPEMETIQIAAATLLQESGARTFKVESRRADKEFPIPSPEISRLLGAVLLRNFPGVRVDIHSPELVVRVEVRRDSAFVYGQTIPGPGGLPVGASGKCLLLLSGGIDSPVAGWMTLKRGARLEALHFHHYPFTSEQSLDKVRNIWRILRRYGSDSGIWAVNLGEIQQAIVKRCPESLRVTLLRRMMFRIATRLAERQGFLALVTGESIGQVASQTVESIRVINEITCWPILRPLAGLDKEEIIQKARQIGTLDLSVQPFEDCCTLFLPRHPRTRPNLVEVRKAEASLEIDQMVERAINEVEHWKVLDI